MGALPENNLELLAGETNSNVSSNRSLRSQSQAKATRNRRETQIIASVKRTWNNLPDFLTGEQLNRYALFKLNLSTTLRSGYNKVCINERCQVCCTSPMYALPSPDVQEAQAGESQPVYKNPYFSIRNLRQHSAALLLPPFAMPPPGPSKARHMYPPFFHIHLIIIIIPDRLDTHL